MKNLKLSLIGATLLSLLSSPVFAGVTDGAGTWAGQGTSYGADGKADGQYQISLTNTVVSDHEVRTEGTVTLPGGKTIPFSQTMEDTAQGFTITADTGKGGAYCFAHGLCQAYIDSGNGQAVALSIVLDGKNAMRFVGTRLEGNQALGFFSEKLSRKQ